jgi:polysaccharide pyruvyl transferase CsaB
MSEGALKRPRLLFSGYYGLGNAGDEAVLAGLLRGLKTAGLDAEATVLSANPEETERWHGVRAVPRMKPSVLKAVAECDLLVSGGGSLLQDVTSQASLIYYLGIVALALGMGKPVAVAAQGMGPLRRPSSRFLTGAVAGRAKLITVRDEASACLLRDCGVRKAIHVTADPAYLLYDGAFRERAEPKTVGLALREWPDRDAASWGAALCVALAARGFSPLLLPMHEPNDRALAEGIREKSGAEIAPKPEKMEDVLQSIARCDLLIGMRLHALLLAANYGIPFLAWSYDPKVEALARGTGNPDSLLALDTPPDDCADLAWDRVRQPPDFDRIRRMREDALQTAKLIANLARP